MKGSRLSIFKRFKTGNMNLTGEAKRQRSIITILAERKSNPADRTRTGIAQQIAEAGDTLWKNIYSGVFRDLDEILLPMRMVEEDGRLPLKRGPKALQEVGVPYYRLTRQGVLVALSLAGPKKTKKLLGVFFEGAPQEEKRFAKILSTLSDVSPSFVSHVMGLYVGAFCRDEMDSLLPFDLARLQKVPDDALVIQREIISAFAKFSKRERDDTIKLLDEMAVSDSARSADDADSPNTVR